VGSGAPGVETINQICSQVQDQFLSAFGILEEAGFRRKTATAG